MDRQSSERQVGLAVGGSALAFGALAVVTPRGLARAFGLRSVDRDFVYMLRFAGVASAALGFNLATAPDDASRRRLLLVGALVDGTNAVLALRAGLSPRTSAMLFAGNGIVALAAAAPIAARRRRER